MATEHGGLSVWHLTMLALGTVVGGSFFLGSAIAIRTAGPGILISYTLGGILVYIILTALSEMTVANQAPGSFQAFAEQMYGPAVGFVVGWVYWTGLTLAMSSEAVAASLFIRAWIPGVPLPAMAVIIIIGVTLLNLVGAKTLTNLESGLALIKLTAIMAFIVIAVTLIAGLVPGKPVIGLGALPREPFLPAGIYGIAGSMLIVMFAYAGFEVIGLAASEAKNPHYTVPRAIVFTILGLVGLYSVATLVLLPLIPTLKLTPSVSPLVAGLSAVGLGWAATTVNAVLVTAILSTMLAAMFGMGRMVRSLADKGYAPPWLREEREVPKRGILFSGAGMLAGVALAYLLPSQVYIFLVASGGFSLLFTYAVIMATHYRFRRIYGCPPEDRCQLIGFPYTSILGLLALIVIIISMPLVPSQGAGLLAGLLLVLFYTLTYIAYRAYLLARSRQRITAKNLLGLAEGEAYHVESRLAPVNLAGIINPVINMEAGEQLVPEKTCNQDTSENRDL